MKYGKVHHGLTALEARFVAAYLACGCNGTKAAIKVGMGGTYGSSAVAACECLKRPKVKAYLEQKFRESTATPEEVMAAITEQARGNVVDFYVIKKDGTLKINPKALKQYGHLLKRVKPGKDGVELEMVDKQQALYLLARIHKLLSDRVEVVGDKDAPAIQHAHQLVVQMVNPTVPKEQLVDPAVPKQITDKDNAVDVEATPL